MTGELFTASPGGGILYDASLARKPDASWFSTDFWARAGQLTEVSGGRGSICFLRSELGDWVLRHYRRGGFVARLSADRYLWTGEARTRSFAEWRLLATLRALGLPVPDPVAAYYKREGLTYRADLITRELPTSVTLTQSLAQGVDELRWRQIGVTIARFHRHGVHHADLNANNILLGPGEVYVLDFDRGKIQPRGAWEEHVLERLHRSLRKVSARDGTEFGEREWQWLRKGYESL
jgi:3-deoxy-D-manno-octulosonic acid kinase